MNKKLFNVIQWTWGLPQTLLGSAVYIANRRKKHFDFGGACATIWDREDGLSLGKFIFLPRMEERKTDGATVVSKELAEHEYGHSLQSLILGPTYLLLIGLPSVIWCRTPYFENKRKKTGKSYYSPVFEKSANNLAARSFNPNKDLDKREQ